MTQRVANSQVLDGRVVLDPTQGTQLATNNGSTMVLQIVNLSDVSGALITASCTGLPWVLDPTIIEPARQKVYGPWDFRGSVIFVMNNTNPHTPARLLVVLGGLEGVGEPPPRGAVPPSLSVGTPVRSTQRLDGVAALRRGETTEFATLGGVPATITATNASDRPATCSVRSPSLGLDVSEPVAASSSVTIVSGLDCRGEPVSVEVDDGDGLLQIAFSLDLEPAAAGCDPASATSLLDRLRALVAAWARRLDGLIRARAPRRVDRVRRVVPGRRR